MSSYFLERRIWKSSGNNICDKNLYQGHSKLMPLALYLKKFLFHSFALKIWIEVWRLYLWTVVQLTKIVFTLLFTLSSVTSTSGIPEASVEKSSNHSHLSQATYCHWVLGAWGWGSGKDSHVTADRIMLSIVAQVDMPISMTYHAEAGHTQHKHYCQTTWSWLTCI